LKNNQRLSGFASKNLLIIGGVVVVVGLLGAYMMFGRGNKPGIVETMTGEDQPFSGTLKAAVALGVPMKCTYTVDGVEYEGYVKGEQYAGKIDAEGKVGNVIIKDDCMWSWSEEETQGVKLCFKTEGEGKSIWDDTDASAANAAANYSYNCRPAAITDDKFNPPSDIEFIDLDAMMNGSLNTEEMQNYLQQFEAEE